MQWTFNAGQPIYLQIVDKLTLSIIRGDYPPGSRLPSVRELALSASVNPNTMQRALFELESRGLSETSRGAGRTVTRDEAIIQARKTALAASFAEEYLDKARMLGLNAKSALELVKKQMPEEEGNGIDTGM